MNVIISNCRVQFTAEDIDFIVEVLRPKVSSPNSLIQLLTDEETRDQILDDESLFRAVLEHRGCLKVSSHFYFYILVRQVLRKSGIEDRSVADYVAEVLAEFSRLERMQCAPSGTEGPLNYFFEMVNALQNADDTTGFYIRTHIGNQSLFLSGIFPDRIRYRAERRGAPDLRFYEELGRMNYRVARDHRLAKQYDLDGIFDVLSERFHDTRRALNDLGERLITLHEDRGINAVLEHSIKFGI